MGCTDSTVVAENKSKPVFSLHPEPSQSGACSVLLGEIQENRFACWNIATTMNTGQEVLTISQRALPMLIAGQHPQKLQLPNFAQLTRIGQTNLYILTGGINFKLDYIYGASYLFNSKANKMQMLPQMKQPRYTHAAVFVNGSLLVLGGRYFGEDDQALLNNCQQLKLGIKIESSEADIEQAILESKTKWEVASPMQVKRCSHITAVYNNRIYAIGGYTGEFQRSPTIEYLDLADDKGWKIMPLQLPFGIESCVASVNSENQITIFGGNSNSGPSASVFTLSLLEGCESIHSNQDLKSAKVLHKLYEHEGHIYFLGGNQNMDIEVYNVHDDQKIRTQSLIKEGIKKKTNLLQKLFESQQKLQALTQTSNTLQVPYRKAEKMKQDQREKDERAFIFGTSSEPFILELNISVPYAVQHPVPLSIKIFALQGAIRLKDTQQYILFGGISDSQEEVNAKTFLLNFSHLPGSRLVACMNVPRYAFGYQMIGDWVYAIGGGSCDQEGDLIILNKCERINVHQIQKTKQPISWDLIADLPVGLISPMTLICNNRLYVFGGMKQNKERFQNILSYNDKSNTWEQLKFTFPFGLEAGSIYNKKQDQYLIFGGRVVNGDTSSIWNLTLINNGEDCVFSEAGKMNEAKCLHKVYKPRYQDFYVILGGQKDVLSFYDCSSMKLIESDTLNGLKEMFSQSLKNLRDKSLKNYTIITNE